MSCAHARTSTVIVSVLQSLLHRTVCSWQSNLAVPSAAANFLAVPSDQCIRSGAQPGGKRFVLLLFSFCLTIPCIHQGRVCCSRRASVAMQAMTAKEAHAAINAQEDPRLIPGNAKSVGGAPPNIPAFRIPASHPKNYDMQVTLHVSEPLSLHRIQLWRLRYRVIQINQCFWE